MGTNNAVIAHVVVLLTKRQQADERLLLEAAEETPQLEIDDVVERVLEGVPEPEEKKKAIAGPKVSSKRRG